MAEIQQQLIWLGAGSARQPNLNFNAFSQVTLVDAREDACLALTQAFSEPTVTVLQQLVSVEAANHSFTCYNLPEFSAISPVTGLKELFPGLKSKSQEQLPSQAINELLEQINAKQQLVAEANTLIIDIPDQALALLNKLIETKKLSLFSNVVISYGSSELYKGMPGISAITELLEKQYFTLKNTDDTDPDLPLYTFKLDAAAKKITELNNKVEHLTEQLASAEQRETATLQQLEKQQAELSKQLAAVKQQADSEKQPLEQQKTELTKQLEAAKQQATSDKQQLEQQKAELAKQLETAKQQASTDKQQLEQQKAELAKQLEAAKQHASTDKQQLEQQKAELAKQLEAAKQQAATDKQQLEQQKAELAEQLEAVNQHAASDKQQLEQQKVELNKQLEAAKQQTIAEQQHKTELAKQLEESKKQLEQQYTELNEQLAEKQHYLSEHEKWNAQLQSDASDLESKLEKTKAEHELDKQNIDVLQSEINKLKNINAELEAEKNNLNVAIQDKLSKLQKDLEEYKKWNGGLKNQISEKDKLISSLETKNADLNAAKDELQTLVLALEKKVETYLNEKQLLTNEIQQKQEALELTQAEVKQLVDEKQHEAHWNKEHKKWAEGLQQQLNVVKSNFDKINKQFNEQQKTISLQVKLLSKLEIDNSDVRHQLVATKQKEQELLDLVKELHQKLKMAAGFYHRLTEDNPDLLVKKS
ncbi:hypothetical protein LMJ53_00910 [Rheinheimera sp. UJ51]|uniref:hypothetical protein n=1 Tax=Rheinheimera sp. UJ51 TaxID=2892446 RepID=UPI001E4A98E1|nr:hypothetical protein [Rheinheimera sp. UJ51]MCC5450294.1 hypothetical protein [Rheinheimera sp. UJ51]